MHRFTSRPVRGCILIALLVAFAFAATPARVQYLLLQGRNELIRERPARALEDFRAAERLQPRRAETQFWLARASRKIGDPDAVRWHLDRAQQLRYPESERLRREWWLLLAETGRVREVEPHLATMLLEPGEDGIEICDAFARGYCLSLQFEPALTLLDAWQKDHPDDYRPHFRRGRIHAWSELQWTKAEAAFREALLRAPEEPAVHRELGKTLVDLRRFDEAEYHLRQALHNDPLDAEALLALAQTLAELKQHLAATECLDRILDHDPGNDPARLLLANITLAAGDAEEAIRQLGPLLERWPEDLKGRYCLAEALRAAGRVDEAESHYKAYADLERNWQRLHQLSRMVQRTPGDAELRYELGLLRLRHESRTEGVAWLHSVFLYAPEHAGAHRALADYYAKIGDVEQARRHLCLSTSPSHETENVPHRNHHLHDH
jgi:predicted Zn-dependent protease